ncbi:MAG: FxLYD domain-containing protein [Methanoregulaceae archaeon]|nr:FxLYD domain-containing protein [Methanoregulaceae archaeon]
MSTFFRLIPPYLMKSGIFVLVLVVLLLCAGCVGPFESGSSNETPSEPASIEPTPRMTVSPEETAVQPLRNMPAELPASGYIERSYGYVPYSPPPEYRLTMIDSNSRRDASGNVIIYGRVKNEGPGSLSYLQMTFNLFDSSGNLVGNAHAHVEYFASGKIWRFESDPAPGANYQYFEIAGIVAQ